MSRTWLITGSSRGIGREIAAAVLERTEDQVLATARNPADLKALVDGSGGRLRAVALDVNDAEAAVAAVKTAVTEFGGLDVVVNTAGYANSGPIEEFSEEDFRGQIETNLFGVVNVTRAALPVFRAQRSGVFLQFSSVGGRVGGTPGMGAYQTAKWAVEGFSEVLATETAPFGVKVVIVEPGAFRTDWQGSSMRRHRVGPDYEGTVGEMNRYREESQDNQPGDPVRAARIVVDIAGHDNPPRRLLLGAGAVQMARASAAERAAEIEEWAELGAAADYPVNA